MAYRRDWRFENDCPPPRSRNMDWRTIVEFEDWQEEKQKKLKEELEKKAREQKRHTGVRNGLRKRSPSICFYCLQ